MANCKYCVHCVKAEISSYATDDGIVCSEWMYQCSIDLTWIDAAAAIGGPCPEYEEDKTRL